MDPPKNANLGLQKHSLFRPQESSGPGLNRSCMCYFFAPIFENLAPLCIIWNFWSLLPHFWETKRISGPLRLLMTFFHQVYYFTKFHLKGKIHLIFCLSFSQTIYLCLMEIMLNILLYLAKLFWWSENVNFHIWWLF